MVDEGWKDGFAERFPRRKILKGASGKKEQPPGAMMALTFLAYLRGQRERYPGQYFSGGFPRGKRGFATPRFSARRRLAVAGGGMVVLQGWKQQIDI